jgi:geranylgeranyl diphosphate synthase type I
LGTFGTEFDSGKSPMDDIREGKRTLITEFALTHTNDDNKNFLLRMLGNTKLTPAQFERCKEILVSSGALTHADATASDHVKRAVDSLRHAPENWQQQSVGFLVGLAHGLLGRTA